MGSCSSQPQGAPQQGALKAAKRALKDVVKKKAPEEQVVEMKEHVLQTAEESAKEAEAPVKEAPKEEAPTADADVKEAWVAGAHGAPTTLKTVSSAALEAVAGDEEQQAPVSPKDEEDSATLTPALLSSAAAAAACGDAVQHAVAATQSSIDENGTPVAEAQEEPQATEQEDRTAADQKTLFVPPSEDAKEDGEEMKKRVEVAVPQQVAIASRREGEKGRVLHVVTFEYKGQPMEVPRYYTDFATLRQSSIVLRSSSVIEAPFPGKTLGSCSGAKLEERMAGLDKWMREAVSAQWPWEGLDAFLGVQDGFGHAEREDPSASGAFEQSA